MFEDSLQKIDESFRKFAKGGETSKRPPKRYDAQKVLADFRRHNEELININKQAALSQVNPYFKRNADPKAKAIVEQAEGTLAALDRGEITYDPTSHTLFNRASRRAYDLKRLNGFYNDTGFSTKYGAGVINLSSNVTSTPLQATASNRSPIMANPSPVVATRSLINSTPTLPAPKPIATGSPVIPPTIQRAIAPAPTTVTSTNPKPATSPIAQGGRRSFAASILSDLAQPVSVSSSFQPLQQSRTFNQAFDALRTTQQNGVSLANSLMSKVPGLNADLSKSLALSTPAASPEPSQTPDILGNVMDLGRVAIGASLAAKKVGPYQMPTRFANWQQQIDANKNQGLSAPEWNQANSQIADNYAAGVTHLNQTLGGGANPGQALTGLSMLNRQRGEQTIAALNLDVNRRQQNQDRYGQMVAQDAIIDRQAYEDRAAGIMANQQAGAQLGQEGLTNIQQRQTYNQNFGPLSLYNKLMGSQVRKEEESIKTLKSIREANMRVG